MCRGGDKNEKGTATGSTLRKTTQEFIMENEPIHSLPPPYYIVWSRTFHLRFESIAIHAYVMAIHSSLGWFAKCHNVCCFSWEDTKQTIIISIYQMLNLAQKDHSKSTHTPAFMSTLIYNNLHATSTDVPVKVPSLFSWLLSTELQVVCLSVSIPQKKRKRFTSAGWEGSVRKPPSAPPPPLPHKIC